MVATWVNALDFAKTEGQDTKRYVIEEADFNSLGYSLLQAGDVPSAIAVFALNVKNFPKSANAQDSLGEAYAKHGEKDAAIACYEKVLLLNPASENAKKMLSELRKAF